MYRVLIIDDEKWSREVIKSLGNWKELGLRIAGEAEDGIQGLEMIAKKSPHIVITDMRMPGIDGKEFLARINRQFPGIKIIVISGYDDFIYLKQAIRSGAVEYLLKPVHPGDLNDALRLCTVQLEDRSGEMQTGWIIPHIFTDPEILDSYLDNRHRVFGFLLELDKEELVRTLAELEKFILRIFPEPVDQSVLDKISHDYILMLEEFLSRNEVGFNQLSDRSFRDSSLMVRCSSVPDLIREISRVYGRAIDVIANLRRNRTRFDFKDVLEYIGHYYPDPISLNTIAQHFYISREHLSRTFKANTGETISDYIVRLRMEKARELILERGLSIKHAAQMTGYSDLTYFYKVFKKYYGCPPGEMKE